MPQSEGTICFVIPGMPAADSANAAVLGSKGYGLLRLSRIGLPVPPAFVLSTDLCREYFARGCRLPESLQGLLRQGLARLEESCGRVFGSQHRPLLVSVRSGAPVSMPGMMDTLLNVGLTDANLQGLLRLTGNPRLARDCYRRLVRDFMVVVHGAPAESFDAIVAKECALQNLSSARDLDSGALERIGQLSLEAALASGAPPLPQSPMEQLTQAVEAVFRSWQSDRARQYRRINHIDDEAGTAVTIQTMVYGNSGLRSGSGVGFTRDPSTGEDQLYLDFLFNAQGEDIVSGRHTVSDTSYLSQRLPQVAAELQRVKRMLESEFRDAQDFEFTVESGKLYLLQTRDAKRTPWAALRIAVDMVRQELLTGADAVRRLRDLQTDTIERVRLDTHAATQPIATAVAAGLGVAVGAIAFDVEHAKTLAAQGRPVILLRPDIFTDDIEGIAAASGILTAAGGRTSHAAVVARQLGKVCLVGCKELRLRSNGSGCDIGDRHFMPGDELTLDGNTGMIYPGRMEVVRERPEAELAQLARWRAALQQ